MDNRETELLYQALCYEQGHPRRTQHILKVYALAKMLGEREGCTPEERIILQAAAILHDIAIRHCKEQYDGDARPERQKQEAPALVRQFLEQAQYSPALFAPILDLVLHHHDYDAPRGPLLQLLMEADLIVNGYESSPSRESLSKMAEIFQTNTGKELFALCMRDRK